MKNIAENTFYGYVLMLVAFFVLLFFTRNIYSEVQVVSDEITQKEIELSGVEDEHRRLTELRKKFDDSENGIREEIQGFAGDFSAKDILEYVHSYAQKVNEGNDEIVLRDITISEGNKTDFGFQVANVNVSGVFGSESTLFNFLNYVTGGTGKYKFYITNLDYPMNEAGGKIQISVPLTLYYK